MKRLLFLYFVILNINCFAQALDSIIERSNTDLLKETINESDDELPTELTKLIEKKININTDDILLLSQINLLSQEQIQAIQFHIQKFGKFIALEELQVIDKIDPATLRNILPYLTFNTKVISNSAKNSLVFRFQQSIKQYIPADFQGDPTKITIKFRGNDSYRFTYGLLAEKDPGEKIIFGSGKSGFDFYSFFFQVKFEKAIRKIIIGDYNTTFGQGLVAWNGSGFSSVENATSLCKIGRGISPSSSSDENRYLRGISTQLAFKNLLCSFWVSSHKVDGNLKTDSLISEKYIQSFLTSGYHRSQSESNGYHTIKENYFGLSLQLIKTTWRIGLTSTLLNYNYPIIKTIRQYNQFEFNGRTNAVSGFDYQKTIRNILFFGETAVSENRSIATLHGSLISIGKNLTLSIIYHNYDKSFHSLKSNAFGSNTLAENENGFYSGISLKINSAWSMLSYINRDEFPFMKYRIDLPSAGITSGITINYQPNKKTIFQIRYKNNSRNYNNSESYVGLKNIFERTITSYRLSGSYSTDATWDWRTRIELNRKYNNTSFVSRGSYFAQDVFYHPGKKKISFNARFAIFYNPDFDLRFYEYENDLPGSFSLPFYSGNGSRFYINSTIKIKQANISFKYARSWMNYSTMKTENLKMIDDVKFQINFYL